MPFKKKRFFLTELKRGGGRSLQGLEHLKKIHLKLPLNQEKNEITTKTDKQEGILPHNLASTGPKLGNNHTLEYSQPYNYCI